MGGICPLFFDGAVCHFHELCKPTDKNALEAEYKYLEKIRSLNNKVITPKSFFSVSLSKKQKELHKKTILSKFAALFRLNNKKY